VLFAGHADAGTRKPVVHPDTGTLIMQTFGQGFHLGYLQLTLNRDSGEIDSYDGKLITVDSDALPAHAAVQQKLDQYRNRYPDIYGTAGVVTARLNRMYNQESDLGNLFADIVRQRTGADVGLMPSGALRKDIAQGSIARIDLLDAFPFTDRLATVEMPGELLRQVLEQGLSLERGILQVSGLTLEYDPAADVGQRLRKVLVDSEPLEDDTMYRVGTIEILAQGGDLYQPFRHANKIEMSDEHFSDVLEEYFSSRKSVSIPDRGRLLAVPPATEK